MPKPSAPATSAAPAVGACCGACDHWSLSPTPPPGRPAAEVAAAMARQGFGTCAHLPAHRFTSPRAHCALQPARFAPARRGAASPSPAGAASETRPHV